MVQSTYDSMSVPRSSVQLVFVKPKVRCHLLVLHNVAYAGTQMTSHADQALVVILKFSSVCPSWLTYLLDFFLQCAQCVTFTSLLHMRSG